MIYWQLFIVFFKIGLFGFGGGLAVISLIQHDVEAYGWMTQQEFVDIVAISQITPGPIGINAATYIGYTATGNVWGSLIATGSIILPSLCIMLLLCKLYFYLQGRFQTNPYFQNTLRMMRFAVLGLIGSAALSLMTRDSFIDYRSWILFAAAFLLTLLPQVYKNRVTQTLSHPILLIILAGAAGYILYS